MIHRHCKYRFHAQSDWIKRRLFFVSFLNCFFSSSRTRWLWEASGQCWVFLPDSSFLLHLPGKCFYSGQAYFSELGFIIGVVMDHLINPTLSPECVLPAVSRMFRLGLCCFRSTDVLECGKSLFLNVKLTTEYILHPWLFLCGLSF